MARSIQQARHEPDPSAGGGKSSHVVFLEGLLSEEVAATSARRLRGRLRFAHLPVENRLRNFDFEFQPSIDRKIIEELATLAFLHVGTHVLLMGPPGTGKTHLGISLGYEAVEAGYRVYYTTAADMVAQMHAAYLEGTWTQRLRLYTGPSLLVIDEVGYLPLDKAAAHAFFQVVDRRNQSDGSICLTTNRSFSSWGEIFEDEVVAAAILYRFLRRRERKRLNQRIAAGAVGMAFVVAAVWILTTGGPLDRTQTPAATGLTGRADPNRVPVPEVDYVIDLNTGVMTPLPEAIIRSLGETGESGQYAVSADGALLAYVGTGDEGSLQIFIAGVDGTGVRQMTHDPIGARSPAWSPDGTRIAYEGFGSGDVLNIFVLDVATGASTQVTDESPSGCASGPMSILRNRFCIRGPQFTPDGSSLIYTGGSDEYPVIRTVPVAGGKSTLLFRPSGGLQDAGNGSLSPDGSLVTFLGSEGNGGAIRFVANADGTDRRIIPGHVSNPAGTWSPDGSRIVCLGDGIIIVDIATGDASPVARGREAIWLDDHTLLVEV